jgi:hypothetical protein
MEKSGKCKKVQENSARRCKKVQEGAVTVKVQKVANSAKKWQMVQIKCQHMLDGVAMDKCSKS